MTPPLITAEQRVQLLAVGEARAAGQSIDPLPAVRLFTPDAHVTWLLAALDPADGDTAWGLIDLGIGLPALGTVKLSDLASFVGPRQQPVMRDRYFLAERPLSEYVRLAQENGSITDRSEEHTSELQSLMRITYAVFCLKKKKKNKTPQ